MSNDIQRLPHANPLMRVRPAELHLRDRLAVFYRYRYIAAIAFVVVFAGAACYAYSQTPLYRATARLLIEIEDERSLAMEGLTTNNNANSRRIIATPYVQRRPPETDPSGNRCACGP